MSRSRRPAPEPRDAEERQARVLGHEYALASTYSLAHYLELVTISSSAGSRRFGEIIEPWQADAIVPILHALEGVAGITPGYSGPTCFWRDLPQGHDKSSGIARIVNGALAFARRPIRAGVFAKDTQQAGRIWKFAQDEARLNPWLGERLQFISSPTKVIRGLPTEIDGITSGGGEIEIHDADPESNAGHKLALCICEELTWWPEKGKVLYDHLYARRHKIEGAVFVVLGNSGIIDTWQHREYLLALQDPEWDVFRTEGSVASWIPPGKLEKDRRRVAPSIARRLFDNEWILESEQAYLLRSELDECEAVASEMGLRAYDKAVRGVKYVASIDYGATKDLCAMCVLGVYPDGTNRVVKLDTMKGSPTNRVSLAAVDAWAELVNVSFRPTWVIDNYQMEWFCQKHLLWPLHRHEYRGGMTNYRMAEHVRDMIVNKKLLWPRNIGLIYRDADTGELVPWTVADEFHKLVTRDMPYGYRFDHKSGHHDDRVVAIGMACWLASQVDLSQPFAEETPIPSLEMQRPVKVEELRSPVSKHRIWGS